jgi:hypothetical protein
MRVKIGQTNLTGRRPKVTFPAIPRGREAEVPAPVTVFVRIFRIAKNSAIMGLSE